MVINEKDGITIKFINAYYFTKLTRIVFRTKSEFSKCVL